MIKCRSGILYPDVSFLSDKLWPRNTPQTWRSENVYSVEIKPKQGWTFWRQTSDADSKLVNEFGDLFDLTGVDKCRFCLTQFLKVSVVQF